MTFVYFNVNNWNSLNEKDGILEEYLSPEIINMKNEKIKVLLASPRGFCAGC